MPAAPIVHVGGHGRHVLDNASLHPCLELEIVGLGVPLIAHLRGHSRIAACHFHQQLGLLEGAYHGFLQIDVLLVLEGHHGHKEMNVVGHTGCHSIEMVGIFLEQLAEIAETLGIGIHRQYLLALLAIEVHIAQGYHLHHIGLCKLLDVLLTTVADADIGDLHLLGFHGLCFL